MSEENLHEKWVPDVAQREGVEAPDQEWVPDRAAEGGTPDQEWLPQHAVVEGFEREEDGHYRCLFCSTRVKGTAHDIERHRAEHPG